MYHDRWGTKPEAEQQHGVHGSFTLEPFGFVSPYYGQFDYGNRPLCLVFHTNPPSLPSPPWVSLLYASEHLVAESPCGPEPCLRSAEMRSTTSIKGLAARIWSADAGSLVFGERAALEQPIPTPLPVSCLACCLKKSDDNLFFVVCTRYAG